MQQGRGSHFDPDVLDAFLTLQAEFQRIAERYADTEADLEEKRHRLQRLSMAQQA